MHSCYSVVSASRCPVDVPIGPEEGRDPRRFISEGHFSLEGPGNLLETEPCLFNNCLQKTVPAQKLLARTPQGTLRKAQPTSLPLRCMQRTHYRRSFPDILLRRINPVQSVSLAIYPYHSSSIIFFLSTMRMLPESCKATALDPIKRFLRRRILLLTKQSSSLRFKDSFQTFLMQMSIAES